MTTLNRDIPKDTNRGAALYAFADATQTHTVTAGDVTAGNVAFKFGATPYAVEVLVFSNATTKKAWNGATTLSGVTVTVDNSGSTDFAAGDRIVVRAY